MVGEVGSGKSTLLNAILEEVVTESGEVKKKGKIAYLAQKPWIYHDTLKENILFGNPFHKQKYKQIIRICELEKDFDLLPNGDETEIGSKGINLSGGQKQRVSLARGLYLDADIYLIDDCLSALDAQVSQSVFNNVIKQYLKSKTVVFVTHGIHFLKKFQHIVVLKEGEIIEEGSYSELSELKGEFSRLAQIQGKIVF